MRFQWRAFVKESIRLTCGRWTFFSCKSTLSLCANKSSRQRNLLQVATLAPKNWALFDFGFHTMHSCTSSVHYLCWWYVSNCAENSFPTKTEDQEASKRSNERLYGRTALGETGIQCKLHSARVSKNPNEQLPSGRFCLAKVTRFRHPRSPLPPLLHRNNGHSPRKMIVIPMQDHETLPAQNIACSVTFIQLNAQFGAAMWTSCPDPPVTLPQLVNISVTLVRPDSQKTKGNAGCKSRNTFGFGWETGLGACEGTTHTYIALLFGARDSKQL